MKLTKILALVLATMMVLAMSSVAFAALGNDTTGTNAQETGVQEGNADSVTINTIVVVTNNETTAAAGKTINYPAMSFKYSVAPATVAEGTTVTDGRIETPEHPEGPAVTVMVKAGVPNAFTVTGGTKESGNVVLNAKGQEAVLVPTTFIGNINAYTEYGAGIYRYMITDNSTTDSTNLGKLTAAGIVKGASTDQEYFLDVYVKNGTDGLEFGGFVLMSGNPGSIDKETNENIDKKKSGFDNVDVITDPTSSETKLDPTKTADLTKNYSYTTYNVTLNKKVMGSLGDKKHGFPFAVAIGVQTVADGATAHPSLGYGYQVTGSSVSSINHEYNALEDIPSNLTLSDGATLKIWGLSPFATINYTETNDTDSAYHVKVGTAADGTDLRTQVEKKKTETLAAWDAAQDVATGYEIGTTATINGDADAVYYTNTLNDVSPTGLVLRFAPYFAMFAAGAALFIILLAKKRKNQEDA